MLQILGLSFSSHHGSHADVDLSLIYRETSDDIMSKILSKLSSDGKGGLNVLRLVSKRLMGVVESCATRLTQLDINGPASLPLALERCAKVEQILCNSFNIVTLEGCPDGLKSLVVKYGCSIQNLEPLRVCTMLERFHIQDSHSILDLSPLSSCTNLKSLSISNSMVVDLSPLSPLSLLEELSIIGCEHVTCLDSLSGLVNLERLDCRDVDPETSLLPLASCVNLKQLICNEQAVGLGELKQKLPELRINCN